VRDILTHAPSLDFVIVDMERVTGLNQIATELLSSLMIRLAENGKQLLFSNSLPCDMAAMQDRLDSKRHALSQLTVQAFPDIDRALEQCENSLLATLPQQTRLPACDDCPVPLNAFVLFRGLDPFEIEALRQILRSRTYQAGEAIIAEGDWDDTVFLLVRGEASVIVQRRSGQEKRLATFSAGMTFGEMALLETSPRSATVSADTTVECFTLQKSELVCLWKEMPHMHAAMLENLACDLSRKLRCTNARIGALGQ
jgi:glutaminase